MSSAFILYVLFFPFFCHCQSTWEEQTEKSKKRVEVVAAKKRRSLLFKIRRFGTKTLYGVMIRKKVQGKENIRKVTGKRDGSDIFVLKLFSCLP